MAISKKLKSYLDSLDDELFIAWLAMKYGHSEPVWEECSQEEYEKHMGKLKIESNPSEWTLKMFEDACRRLFSSGDYKAEPVYNNFQPGLLWQINCQGKKPDGWRYYKSVGRKFVLCLGGDIFDYCKTRECMKNYFGV